MAETAHGGTAAFTIVSKNYWHHARVLMKSLAAAHPGWACYVLLCDENGGEIDPGDEGFTVVSLDAIGLPEPRKFCFRYTILELNTAVKPWMCAWVFAQGHDKVVYLDPDIRVYRPMTELEEALGSGAMMVLTPHLTAPLGDAKKPAESDILRAGSFNLGFLGLARRPGLESMLVWWQDHLERECVVDFERGLFVDQKWMDMAPGLFGGAVILRHPGYNVAYWNLLTRKVTRTRGGFTVSGEPLAFFHFSGLNIKAPQPLSKHQNRFTLDTIGDAKLLVEGYCLAVQKAGYEACHAWPYAFARFEDGTEIAECLRRFYRNDPRLETAAGENPFASRAWLNRPVNTPPPAEEPPITLLMEHVWRIRPDLRHHFADPFGADRRPFAHWFAHTGVLEFGLSDVFAMPVLEILEAEERPLPAAQLQVPTQTRPAWKRALGRLLGAPAAAAVADPAPPPPAPPKAPPEENDLPFGANYRGFYDEEEFPETPRAVWMGPAGHVRLPWEARGALVVIGVYAREYMQRSSGSTETTVDVLVDGESRGGFRLGRSGPFESEVDLRGGPVVSGSVLTLRPSQHFVPADFGAHGDTRKLTLRVAKVRLGGRDLLDFDRAEDPYAPDDGTTPLGLGVNLAGYVKGEFGIGQSVRSAAAAMEAAAIPFTMVDFNEGSSARVSDDTWAHRITRDNPHEVNVFHVNADQIPLAHSHLGAPFFEGRHNVGYWAWELPEFPERWVQAFAYVDEVWTPSDFCTASIAAKSPVPVLTMPHSIRFETSPTAGRSDFHLPEGRFLFLSMYDMNSFQDRKNPEAAIEAFRRAFPTGEGAGLVIKTQNTGPYPKTFARLKALAEESPGITLIDRTLSRQEIHDLENLVDAFVSLHRSEGFGLGLAECMYLGKPVVGTGWSGNLDFMDHRNSCLVDYKLTEIARDAGPYRRGQIWAEPDVDSAATHMARLAGDRRYYEEVGREAHRTIRERFSPEAVGVRYRKRLMVISRIRRVSTHR